MIAADVLERFARDNAIGLPGTAPREARDRISFQVVPPLRASALSVGCLSKGRAD